MAKQIATTKQTGGSGFNFEDKVSAQFLVKLLSGEPSLEPRAGRIESIRFQKRVDGWHLDDMVLTLRNHQGDSARLCLSVKSTPYITKAGFPEEFTVAVWEQILKVGKSPFNIEHDFLGIATAPLDIEVSKSWNGLLGKAIVASTTEFERRINTSGYSNDIERALFNSLRCPTTLGVHNVDTTTVLQRVRCLAFDFENHPSDDENTAISACQKLLRSGDYQKAISLWEHLKQICREYASNGGDIDSKASLARMLRGHFDLAEFPDHVPDWRKLSEDTTLRLSKIRNRLGGVLNLERKDTQFDLDKGITVIIGASGSGKSAIASQIAQRVASSGHAVWLPASMLNQQQSNTLFSELNLRHSFAELLVQSTVRQGVIVVDGAEHLTEDGLANLVSLIEIAGVCTSGTPWRMVITCVFDQWENLLLRLKRQLTTPIVVDVRPIEFRHHHHRKAIVESFPQLQHMLSRPQIGRLFDNLKILDLVASNASNVPLSEAWVGETDTLDWYWKEVVNRGANEPGRSRFLMKLACFEADRFLSEVPSMDFESSECEFVSALIADDVIWEQDDRFGFTHDLLGDWARSRYLLSHKETIGDLAREKVLLPRWQKAIRLYGLRLLESHGGGKDQWNRLIADLQGNDALSVELDLILESVVFAANADQLFPKVWATLIANDALLLKRLLTRFLHTATMPNPRMGVQLSEVSTTAAAYHRLPFWPLWGPILRLLHEQQEEAVALAPLQIARIASMWLRMTPESWLLRTEAAEVMIAVTEFVIQHSSTGRFVEELEKEAFAGLLAAAPVFPDLVASRALELVERGEASPFAHKNRVGVKLKKTPANREGDDSSESRPVGERIFEAGPLRDSWPNGPRRRVQSDVRKGFLASHDPLQYLLRVRPNAAIEVLLALLIEEPSPTFPPGAPFGHDDFMDYLELDSYEEFTPPMHFRGPFLSFLRTDAQKGIEAIVALITFATERWLEKNPDASAIECNIDGEARHYYGGADLYHWYRVIGNRHPIHVAESALMALERWLYECIDDQQDVSPFVVQLLRESQSTAVLGVLSAIGRRQPVLFKGSLRCLIPLWRLQVWEEEYRLSGASGLIGMELMSWFRWGEDIWNMVRDWYHLEHRKTTIGDVLFKLYITDEDVRDEFNREREKWAILLSEMSDPDQKMRLANLVRKYDDRNWKTRIVENGVLLEYFEPEGVTKELAHVRETLERRQHIYTLPLECRKLLDEGKGLPVDDLRTFFDKLQQIKNDAISDPEVAERWKNAVMGGIVVLWIHHSDWVEADDYRKEWCETTFVHILSSPPTPNGYHPANSISNYYWDNFVALLAPRWLAEDLTSEGIRNLVANYATAFKYSVVADVLASAFHCRQQLGDDFHRLLHLVVVYSSYCNIQVTTHGGNSCWDTPDVEYDIEGSLMRMIYKFVDRSLSPEVPSLSEIAMSSNATIAGMVRDQDHRRSDPHWTEQEFASIQKRINRGWGFEPALIQTAFSWIDRIDLEDDPADREKWVALLGNILDAFLRPLGNKEQAIEDDETNSFYDSPCDQARWLFDRIAVVISKLHPEEHARRLWVPILRLGLDRVHWVDTFFFGWFIHAPRVDGTEEAFFREWQEMIGFAWEEQGWRHTEVQHRHGPEKLFRSLMGLDFTGEYYLCDPKYRSFVTDMKPEYDRWADEFLDELDSAKSYARFLTAPSATRHVRDGIRRLSERVSSYDEWCWREDRHLHTVLLDLLEYDWRNNGALIMRDVAIRKQFSTILKAMLDRQIPRAMELQDQISRG